MCKVCLSFEREPDVYIKQYCSNIYVDLVSDIWILGSSVSGRVIHKTGIIDAQRVNVQDVMLDTILLQSLGVASQIVGPVSKPPICGVATAPARAPMEYFTPALPCPAFTLLLGQLVCSCQLIPTSGRRGYLCTC
jgi:hypothetical protein